MKKDRGWKDMKVNLRKRILQFCKRNKIKMKRASRQVYKDPKLLSAAIAAHIRHIRRITDDYGVKPEDISCFDEIRVYASPLDLKTMTLEVASKRDPLVRKIANPREAYTGIVMASGDGQNLVFVLVTTKGLPTGYPIHKMSLEKRKWDKDKKKVVVIPTIVNFVVIHGITVLKVPPGFKAWCSGIITEAFCRMFMSKCDRPSILQVDRAPGHIDPVFNRLVAESGRIVVWTPPGTSGYVQACDDIINASIQQNFSKVSTDWLIKKVMDLQKNGDFGSVANPTLEEMCQILAKSISALTPAAQRRAFQHCLLTLPTDGSLDEEKGSKNLMDLMKKNSEVLVPSIENSFEMFPLEAPSTDRQEGAIAAIWESLINCEKDSLSDVDFHHDPSRLAPPHFVMGKSKRKEKNRFKCAVGCGVDYATKAYPMARVHAEDCPTRAFILSHWRPFSKTFLASNGFLFRHDAIVESDQQECKCPEACNMVHVID